MKRGIIILLFLLLLPAVYAGCDCSYYCQDVRYVTGGMAEVAYWVNACAECRATPCESAATTSTVDYTEINRLLDEIEDKQREQRAILAEQRKKIEELKAKSAILRERTAMLTASTERLKEGLITLEPYDCGKITDDWILEKLRDEYLPKITDSEVHNHYVPDADGVVYSFEVGQGKLSCGRYRDKTKAELYDWKVIEWRRREVVRLGTNIAPRQIPCPPEITDTAEYYGFHKYDAKTVTVKGREIMIEGGDSVKCFGVPKKIFPYDLWGETQSVDCPQEAIDSAIEEWEAFDESGYMWQMHGGLSTYLTEDGLYCFSTKGGTPGRRALVKSMTEDVNILKQAPDYGKIEAKIENIDDMIERLKSEGADPEIIRKLEELRTDLDSIDIQRDAPTPQAVDDITTALQEAKAYTEAADSHGHKIYELRGRLAQANGLAEIGPILKELDEAEAGFSQNKQKAWTTYWAVTDKDPDNPVANLMLAKMLQNDEFFEQYHQGWYEKAFANAPSREYRGRMKEMYRTTSSFELIDDSKFTRQDYRWYEFWESQDGYYVDPIVDVLHRETEERAPPEKQEAAIMSRIILYVNDRRSEFKAIVDDLENEVTQAKKDYRSVTEGYIPTDESQDLIERGE